MTQKVAFVDDEQSVLESLKWVFKDEPYEIFIFTDPFELLAKFDGNEFAVVVADQVMPEIEGIPFLQLVKEKSPATVCIIMTAHADLKIAIDAMNKGNIFRFVFKPWDIVEIKTAVKNAVDLYELKSEIRRLWQVTKNQNEQLLELNQKLKDKVDEQSDLTRCEPDPDDVRRDQTDRRGEERARGTIDTIPENGSHGNLGEWNRA